MDERDRATFGDWLALLLVIAMLYLLCCIALTGCGPLSGITSEPSGWHSSAGIKPGDSFTATVTRLGRPMKERWYNPKAPDSFYPQAELRPDFTGWAWWTRRPETAIGVRYESGVPVEYGYGFNHWAHLMDAEVQR